MNEAILITGGLLRPNGFELGEGKYYGCAKLLRLDIRTAQVETLLSIDVGNENYPDEYPNLEFTVGDVDGKSLWLATDTEIRHYSYPTLDLIATFSHPCFHNIHSVAVRGDELYVTSTGLDMVVVLNKRTGNILRHINTEGKLIWHRFSSEVDYRKLHSTRPHDSHPNFVFWVEDEPWVTRCTQEDAVMLRNPTIRINITGRDKPINLSVHDGIVKDGYIYFTTVDGRIVIADAATQHIANTVNITKLKGYGGLRGWCRGLYLTDEICYVGFSRFRKTMRMEKLEWIKRLMLCGETIEECSVLALDLKQPRILADYRIPRDMLDALYSVIPVPKT